MRHLLASLVLLAAAAAPARAADIRFERVWLTWHDTASFDSYYEYHTGNELVGKWTILRSQPNERTGLYFEIRIQNPGAPVDGKIVVRVIGPDSIDPRVFTFNVQEPAGSRLFVVGITGADWPFIRVVPVAWDVELQDADGRILAKKTSFLWEKPSR
jgi:hypothetical protein